MERKLDFDDVLIQPRYSEVSSRKDVALGSVYNFKYAKKVMIGVPIIAANMANIGTPKVAKVMNEHHMFTALCKGVVPYDRISDTVSLPNSFVTFGMESGYYHDMICLDVANGYMEDFLAIVEEHRAMYQDAIIMAGNVATPEGTEALIYAGADIVKVGIGSGGACTTRLKTGVGYPQFSAIIECAKAAKQLGGYICSDGGHRVPGDLAKSYAAGADFVMLGSMLAGTNETGTRFYGSSSYTAQLETDKEIKDYRASEGRDINVRYKGGLSATLSDICGGLRSACSYVGARSLRDLPNHAEFIRVRDTHNRIFE